MRVFVYPADEGGCGHYRMIWPGEALRNQGADVRVIHHDDPDARFVGEWVDDIHELEGGRRVSLARPVRLFPVECDIAVLQRPLRRQLVQCIPHLQAQGVKVVVEVDDDFESISPRNRAWVSVQPGQSPERNHAWLRMAVEMADLVTVSTLALQRRYGGVILPNYVPKRYLDISLDRDARERPVIGWSGSVETHPDDLQQVGSSVRRLASARKADVGVVGTGTLVQRHLGLPQPPLVAGWVHINQYAEYLVQFDIGIVPLEHSQFNEAKSWLKGLEMAAVGVPFVATPTVEYRRLHHLEVGQLADKPKEWYSHLSHMISYPELRTAAAETARLAASRLTIEEHCGRWWDAWKQLV